MHILQHCMAMALAGLALVDGKPCKKRQSPDSGYAGYGIPVVAQPNPSSSASYFYQPNPVYSSSFSYQYNPAASASVVLQSTFNPSPSYSYQYNPASSSSSIYQYNPISSASAYYSQPTFSSSYAIVVQPSSGPPASNIVQPISNAGQPSGIISTIPQATFAPPTGGSTTGSSWSGFQGVQYLFAFGDSYTGTGFNPYGAQPAPGNPMGNPPMPGGTTSNGPNWIEYLTVTHNQSSFMTFNFAYGGATVDSSIIKPYADSVKSLTQQINEEYIPIYGGHPTSAPWTASNSLFSIWIGINDIVNSCGQGQDDIKRQQVIAAYAALLEVLYTNGARNFLVLNVPAIDRSEYLTSSTAAALAKPDITALNSDIATMLITFKGKHSDVTYILYDSNTLFNKVLDTPTAYPATANLKVTNGFCDAYAGGTPQPDTMIASCAAPADQYFWLNNLHPTFPVHQVVAAEVAQALG